LRHREDHPANVRERALHLPCFLEDPEAGDLGGETFAVLGAVVHADSEEHDDTGFDLGYALHTDVEGGRPNTLNDRAR
jgi:hypothetical protein